MCSTHNFLRMALRMEVDGEFDEVKYVKLSLLNLTRDEFLDELEGVRSNNEQTRWLDFDIDCAHDTELGSKCAQLVNFVSSKILKLRIANVNKYPCERETFFTSTFRELQYLKLEHPGEDINDDFDDMLALCGSKLQLLSVSYGVFKNTLLECLRRSSELQVLEVKNCSIYFGTRDDSTISYECQPQDFNFKLKHLEFHSDEIRYRFIDYAFMLKALFLSQSSTLQVLVLRKTKLNAVSACFVLLKALKQLTVTLIWLEDGEDLTKTTFAINRSIERLETDLLSTDEIKPFLQASTQLQELVVDIISVDLKSYSSRSFPNLRVQKRGLESFNENSLDPLNYLEEKALELVFHNLRGRDVLTLSEVSKSWNNKIALSSILMSKLTVTYSVSLRESMEETARTSTRRYQNAKANFLSSNGLILHFVNSIEKTALKPEYLVSLDLSNISFFWCGYWYEYDSRRFSNMKELKFNNVIYNLVEFFLFYCGNGPQMRKLFLKSTFITDRVTRFLKKCESLKELTLIDNVGHNLSVLRSEELCFQLEVLHLKTNKFFERKGDVCTSLIKPLISSCKLSLRECVLEVNDPLIVNFFLGTVEKLERLSLRNLWQSTLDQIDPKFHPQLTSLKALNNLNIDIPQSSSKPCVDVTVLDPVVRLPEILHALVFQHFRGPEIIEISTVSKSWWNFTAVSNVCMEKLELKLWDDSAKLCCLESLKKSKRKYQNVSCRALQTEHFNAAPLNTKYEINMPSVEALEHFFVDLKTLRIPNEDLMVGTCLTEFCIEDFPNLEILDIGPYDSNPREKPKWFLKYIYPWKKRGEIPFLECFTEKTPKLKEFKFTGSLSERSISIFRKFFQDNTNLKKLLISDCKNVDLLFKNFFEGEFKFQLEQLEIPFDEDTKMFKTQVERNFIRFLESQLTLESISLVNATGPILNTVFNKMKHLGKLQFGKVVGSGVLKLEKALNLKTLKLPLSNNLVPIEKYLRAAPNLEILYIEGLSIEIVDFVANNLTQLRTVEYFDVNGHCLDHYEQLKRSNGQINRDIHFIKTNCLLRRFEDRLSKEVTQKVFGSLISKWLKLSIDPKGRTTIRLVK